MAGGLGKLAVNTTIDTFGGLAKRFVGKPKTLNMLGNSSIQTKKALTRTFSLDPQAGKAAADLLDADDIGGYRKLVADSQLDYSKNATDHRTSQITHPTNLDAVENLKYPRYQVDESLPFKEQKRIFKTQVADYINQEWAAGNKIDLPVAYKKFGQLINPETGLPVHLKYKTTNPKTGYRSYQPKPQETTAKEVAKRRSREEPWKTNRKEIEEILESAGKKEKLAELLTLMRTEYNNKVNSIRQAGMSKGHIKSLDNGGLDIVENIQPEPLKTVDGVPGNAARSSKNDLPDAAIRKQGGFVGTLEEYILMKLKQLE
tara:strand:+ start:323 stop:1270 length:948 start_codon:yes stop_codon:yes gene_type:complete